MAGIERACLQYRLDIRLLLHASFIPQLCVLQDDKAMFLFGDDDEIYQEDSLIGSAPTQSKRSLAGQFALFGFVSETAALLICRQSSSCMQFY